MNLPSNWNGRALQMGGGGSGRNADHRPDAVPQPAARTADTTRAGLSSRSDRTAGTRAPGGSFALNDEALLNYGQQSIKKTHDAAMALIDAAYADEPDYFYFIGFSQGGHEALDAAARYSKDYDGVVAGTPTYNVTMMHAGHGSVYRDALYENGGAGWVNPAKQALLVNVVYATCDPIDGLADGIISDTEGCLDAFDVQTLRCAGGVDLGEQCLSDAQIATLDTLASDNDLGFEIAGNSIAAAFPVYNGGLLGTEYSTGLFGRYHLGLTQVPHNPATSQDAWHYQVGDTNAKYFVTKNPTLDYLDFDLHAYEARVQELGTIMDTTDRELPAGVREEDQGAHVHRAGRRRGVAVQHDPALRPDRRRSRPEEGGHVPAVLHGPGNEPRLRAVRRRLGLAHRAAELGGERRRPGAQTIVDTNVATAGRTRPLCLYPTWPQYIGGDPNSAASFSCVP